MIGLLLGIMMGAGVFLVFYAMSRPPEEDDLATRLSSYSARPPSLEEIEMQKPFSERMIKPLMEKLSARVASMTPEKSLEQIRTSLEAAGNPNNLTVADFLGLQGFAALVGVGAAFLLTSGSDNLMFKLFGPVFGLLLGFRLPMMWINGKVSTRQKELTLSMPDCLDLLTISVEAGMGFEQALQTVVEKWDNALTFEFGRVLREQRMGKSRREALRALALRCNAPDLTTFTSAIIQGEQLGVSISRILQVQSEQMRVKRRQKAEKLAHEAPLKMTFPMVMFMMPALWIVILGPMWPNLAIMLSGGSPPK